MLQNKELQCEKVSSRVPQREQTGVCHCLLQLAWEGLMLVAGVLNSQGTQRLFQETASSAGHSGECCLQLFANTEVSQKPNRALALPVQSDLGAAPGSLSTAWKSHILGHTQVPSDTNVLLQADTTLGWICRG